MVDCSLRMQEEQGSPPPLCVCFEIVGSNPWKCKDLQDTPSNIKLDHEPKDQILINFIHLAQKFI